MQCASCKHENPNEARFCLQCGAPFGVRCSNCGRDLPGDARFCLECGQSVTTAGAPAPAERSPRSYTPKHLADKILQSKSALEGERKQVTVLFADVKGSMDLAEQVDPEEWHRILNRFFEILTDGVHRFEGTVNQYTGDGIMALFGAPIAHEDHAQRACYAALRLGGDLRRYANELRQSKGLSFSVRMGLNSGEVIVGKIGDDLRMDYTAQGHTVGLAARMEQLAEPGKVYLTEHTGTLVSGYFELEDLGRFDLPGARESVGAYALQGIGRLRTRLDVSLSRGLSKFVGRLDEMATLEAALERAIAGNAQVVGVVGEAGVGKSRLCLELIERCRAQGLAVFEAHGLAHAKGVAFLPILELLRSYFGIEERDSEEVARDKIAGRTLRLNESLADALPLLFDFLGVPDPQKPAPQMDPEARQRELFEITRRLSHARSERGSAVFLIEDLHWLDGASEGFLGSLIESLPGTRTLVLVNFRPEYRAPWAQKSYYQQLPLVPLGPEAIRELMRDLLGSDQSVDGLADLIRERTGGNPFFIEEIVQSLEEAGTLEGSKGTYRLTRPVAELSVPGTVQVVLAARIDRLHEREKQLLQTASVIGKKFSEPVLKEVAELPEKDLAEALRVLIASEFIYEEALYPETEYAFRHPLTQEVAYDSQLSDRRARVHQAVARALEALDLTKLDEWAGLLAHHWEQAGDLEEAAGWYHRAALQAGINDLLESQRHWAKLQQLLDRLPQTKETVAQGAVARSHLILLSMRLGGSDEEATALFREAEERARRSGDVDVLTLALNSYGAYKLFSGRVSESIPFLEEGVRHADEASEPELQIRSRITLVPGLLAAGRLVEAVAEADVGIGLSQEDLEMGFVGYSPHLWLLGQRGAAFTEMGLYERARENLDRTLRLARQRGEALPAIVAAGEYLSLDEAVGDVSRTIGRAREAIELAEKTGHQAARAFAYEALGRAYMFNHEWDDSLDALNTSLEIAHEHNTGLQGEARTLTDLARVHHELGDPSRARTFAEKAIEVVRKRGADVYGSQARIVLARVLLQANDPGLAGEIEAALESATSLVEQTGAERYRPLIHEVRTDLARLLGDEAEQKRQLREAHRLYTEMGATGHAERVARELGR